MTSPPTHFLDGAYTPRATPDSEEWSDVAISALLDSYTEKCKSRFGNFRVKDWEEVAGSVNEMCERPKTVDQCKNKVDNLKKRCNIERIRSWSDGESERRWPWFRKMESIGGGFVLVRSVSCDEKFGGGRAKRYTAGTSSPSGLITNMDRKPVTNTRWRRVVLKISGDALAGTESESIDPKVAMLIAKEVSMACHNGVEVAIIVGGRNLYYGDSWEEATNLDRILLIRLVNADAVIKGTNLPDIYEGDFISRVPYEHISFTLCSRVWEREESKGK